MISILVIIINLLVNLIKLIKINNYNFKSKMIQLIILINLQILITQFSKAF